MPRPKKTKEQPEINPDDLDTLQSADVPDGDLADDLADPQEIDDDSIEKTPSEALFDKTKTELAVVEADAETVGALPLADIPAPTKNATPGTRCAYCASTNTQSTGNRQWCNDCHQYFISW